eukprot:7537639-Pyramimonas_sp.AAC.1
MSAWRRLVRLRGRANPSAQRPAVWRDRRGRSGADRRVHPSGHFAASRRLGRARYRGNADDGR